MEETSINDEDLRYFFGAYFHQDWMSDAQTWESVVEHFVADDGPARAQAVAPKLRELIDRTSSDDALCQIIDSLGCYFWPGSPEAMRPWLTQLIKLLSSHAANMAVNLDAKKPTRPLP